MTEPIEQRIGNFSVCMDVNADGDLQIRVYPLMTDGQPWDCPFSTFEVLSSEVADVDPEKETGPLRNALQNLVNASDALTAAIEGATDQFDAEKVLKGGAE